VTWRDYPSPDRLARHPQLAALAMLETAAFVASDAILAAHPEIWLEDEHGPMDDRVPKEVRGLLDRARLLRKAIARYHALIDRLDAEARAEPYDSDDVPF
jgi:hypothetical protein